MRNPVFLLLLIIFSPACRARNEDSTGQAAAHTAVSHAASYDTTAEVIHVWVALCDNQYQGIVPVPEKIGNGQDPPHNLYWGCAFGVKTFFSKSKDWQLLRTSHPGDTVLERLVFRHRNSGYYLVADAVDGRHIKACTRRFLASCAGSNPDTIELADKTIGAGSNAQLLCYVGHDGLMDFGMDQAFSRADQRRRSAIVLACYSKRFFAGLLQQTGAEPLLWSTGLMSPEAYTLHDALDAYVRRQPVATLRKQAAAAYSRYQKCSGKAALGLLVSGY